MNSNPHKFSDYPGSDESIRLAENSIDLIEKEIQQIDNIVNSWSQGKTLRFDPAHVESKEPPRTEHDNGIPSYQVWIQSVMRFNQVAFGVVALLALLQFAFALVTMEVAFCLAVLVGMAMAVLNLIFIANGNDVLRPESDDTPAREPNARRPLPVQSAKE